MGWDTMKEDVLSMQLSNSAAAAAIIMMNVLFSFGTLETVRALWKCWHTASAGLTTHTSWHQIFATLKLAECYITMCLVSKISGSGC